MDIRCEKCGTEYILNDAQIPPDGIRVKCETCQHIFYVSPYEDDEEDAADAESPEPEEPQKEFMIRRKAGGSILRFVELDTLHQWIRDGVVGPQDEIGTTGDAWAELGRVPELQEIFAEVRASRPSTGKRSRVSVEREAREPSRISTNPSAMAIADDREPELGAADLRSLRNDPIVTREFPSDPAPRAARRRWPWVVGISVLVIGGCLGLLFATGILPSPFPGKSRGNLPQEKIVVPDDDNAKVEEARKQMEVGTAAGYSAAAYVLQECKTPACREHAALALALWAYVLDEDVAIFISKLPPQMSDEEKKQRASKLHDEMRAKARQALDTAQSVSPETVLSLSATGIAQVLLDEPGSNVSIEKAGLKDKKNPYYILAKALYFQNNGDLKRAIATLEPLTQAHSSAENAGIIFHYALGRMATRMQDFARAAKEMDYVCNQRPDHLVACQLAADLASLPAGPVADTMTPPDAMAPETDMPPDMVPSPMPDTSIPDSTASVDDERGNFDYDTYYSKAEQYYRAGDKASAKKYYLKAASKDPTSVDAFNGAAYCDLDTGNAMASIPNFRKALALVPNFTKAQYGLAEALYQTGQKHEALSAYRRFLQLNPPESPLLQRARMMVSMLENELGVARPPEMTEPAPMEPEMTEPAPMEPEMTEPAPMEPEMTEPAPMEPEMTEPAPNE